MCLDVYKIIYLWEDSILEWNCILQTYYFLKLGFGCVQTLSRCSERGCFCGVRRLTVVGLSSRGCVAGSAVVVHVLSCPTACDPPGPGVKPVFSALAGGFLTTWPPGSPKLLFFFLRLRLMYMYTHCFFFLILFNVKCGSIQILAADNSTIVFHC